QLLVSKSMKFAWVLVSLCLLISGKAYSQPSSELLAPAQEAYKKQDLARLQAYSQEMKAKGDILAPYADYWIMLLKLSSASNREVTEFIQRYEDFPFADRVRGEWLKQLGKRREWQTYFAELPNFKRDDAAINCYTMQGQANLG